MASKHRPTIILLDGLLREDPVVQIQWPRYCTVAYHKLSIRYWRNWQTHGNVSACGGSGTVRYLPQTYK